MWNNIKQVLLPKSLEEAVGMVRPGAVYHAGGTYLAAERPEGVDTLIEINGLLPKEIHSDYYNINIGAGVTVQQLADAMLGDDRLKLGTASHWSSFSKNIRNQRTIGGEIGRGRVNSELYVLLCALPVTLSIAGKEESGNIEGWKNEGLITSINIHITRGMSAAVERFALIESAPPFVVTAVVKNGELRQVAVGGSCTNVSTYVSDDLTDEKINGFAHQTATTFKADHIGSVAYKESVIATGIRRGRDQLCK